MLRNVWRLPTGRVAIVMLVIIGLLAAFGSALAPFPPNKTVGVQLLGPSGEHWLGTDYVGRDVLSRLLAGSALSVWGASLVAIIALVFGAVPGVLSVYLGRTFEW